ncbi:hypothetical protein THAOC_25523 [Thalassiosira oceanica]|uniref:MYND-type domain-containing protein n=1 Tax=Thalassiosira oceanica TaxID=159749 RepID=K0S180_THAOC|nr:hypothetical protein THAOC_25523 [Thalassiosira oceanica]|eukprot:EJK54816.1 hypothetical protein THAOC_25523 [Thalassiosira oceanica]
MFVGARLTEDSEDVRENQIATATILLDGVASCVASLVELNSRRVGTASEGACEVGLLPRRRGGGVEVCRHIKHQAIFERRLSRGKERHWNYPGFSVRSASGAWKTQPMSDEPLDNSSAGPKAGDDEERQKTDEERLMEEIVEQKDLVDALTCDTHEEIVHRNSQEKKLGQLEFKYHLMVEKKRLGRVLLKFQELYGDLYSETCLICLDDIHVHASESLTKQLVCCGGFICSSCARDIRESDYMGFGGKCPLCRGSFGDKTEAENAAKLMTLAKRGVIWAQTHVGKGMIDGAKGFKKQVQTGLEWINQAAAQNYPAALYQLYNYYRDGIAPELENSEGMASENLMKAANLGYAAANSTLAKCYIQGTNGFEEDPDEFYFRASVAFALENTNEQAAFILGSLHYFGFEKDTPEPFSYLACHYQNIVVNDSTGAASYFYGHSLLRLSDHLHGNNIASGSNDMPAVVFWLRKSLGMGYKDARELLKKLETDGQSLCANCSKEAKTGEKFKQCSKCKAQWYCCKECQVEAWRAGHKKDCKRAAILKFEDYLNAE